MNSTKFSLSYLGKTGTSVRAISTFKTVIATSEDLQKKCREFRSVAFLIMRTVQKFRLLLPAPWCAAFFPEVNLLGRRETKGRTNWSAQMANFIFWWFRAANGFM